MRLESLGQPAAQDHLDRASADGRNPRAIDALPRLICYRASIVASEFLLPKGGTMSTMSPEGRRELVAAVIERYRRSTPAARERILDEFGALTGYHRKHAIRVLNGNSAAPAVRRGRRSVYDEAVTEGWSCCGRPRTACAGSA